MAACHRLPEAATATGNGSERCASDQLHVRAVTKLALVLSRRSQRAL